MRKLRLRSALLISAVPLAAGCPDDTTPGDGSGGSTGPNSTGITATDTNDDTTSSTGDDSLDDTGTDESTSTGVEATCETILCGDPASCCQPDEDCINDACVPACTEGPRCGENLDVCCDAGDVCLSPSCVTPTGCCVDSFDCEAGEFCEPTLGNPDDEDACPVGQCLPQQDPVVCEIQPDFQDVEVTLEWSITGIERPSDEMEGVDQPDDCDDTMVNGCDPLESLSMPAVGDIDGDGMPEVVVNTWRAVDGDGGSASGGFYGHIVVLDGTTGNIQFRVQGEPGDGLPGSWGRSTVGIANVDDNPLPDIVYVGRPEVSIPPFANNSSRIRAVNGLGQELWASEDPMGDPFYVYVRHGAPSFGNWDSDDASEIVFGTTILDNDGVVVFDQPNPDFSSPMAPGGGGTYGSNGNYWGGISAIADLNGDGVDDIVSGREAWEVDWVENVVGPPTVTLTRMWAQGTTDTYSDGYPAVADIDLDGDPEVILVGEGNLYVLEGDTGELWCGIDPDGDASDCPTVAERTQPLVLSGVEPTRGGPPTVADFDGDGLPEVGIAGDDSFTVYDFYRAGEDIVQPGGFPPPNLGEIFVRWTNTTQDASSKTGASVFDFQGDGVAEVVYGDECYLRVYDGSTGSPILEIENSSATIHEYPIVVDVDADGNSEILVVANLQDADDNCIAEIPGYEPRHGVFVYGDPNDQWVRTRRVWNSHEYHVTNATSEGAFPPMGQLPNWAEVGLNNFRQNAQGEGVFNAPDLTVQLAIGSSNCLDDEWEVIATVRNTGSLGIGAGIPVTLYEGTDATGELVGTQDTQVPLLPGGETSMSWLVDTPGEEELNFFVLVDNDNGDPDSGILNECNEDNQTSTATSISCGIEG